MHFFAKTAIVTAIGACLPHTAFAAAAPYNNSINYPGGAQVCYNGLLFETNWWANAGQSPAAVATANNTWDTPWKPVQDNANTCSTGGGGGGTQNTAPNALASASATDIVGSAAVQLIAVGSSDPDGDTITYHWQQIATGAPSLSIAQANTSEANVILPDVNTATRYQFRVVVSDGTLSSSANISLHQQPGAFNQAPIAAATSSDTQVTGSADIELSGHRSSDPDGDALDYQWQQISPTAPLASFSHARAATTRVSLPSVNNDTSYVFRLTVSDGQLSAANSVTVQQSAEGGGGGGGNTGSSCATWSAATVYNVGDVLLYNTQKWAAQWWTQGEQPGSQTFGAWRASTDACAGAGANTGGGNSGGGNSGGGGNSDGVVSLSQLQADEAELTNGQTMQLVQAAIATLDNNLVDAIAPGLATNPANVKRLETILSANDWAFLFPRRAPEYTYTKYLQAVGKFPAFCGDYDDGRDADAICRKALATMFAHFTQETGGHTSAWPEPQWRQGLVYVRELGWTEDTANGYGICDPTLWQGQTWPCGVFPAGHPNAGQNKSYFGRGAKQLSYNYNYGPFSQAMFGDVNTLLQQPDLVADTWLNLASAVFFYVYPQPPKPNMLHVVDGTWQPNAADLESGLLPGFGVTTQIINGGIECGGAAEHPQSQNRIDYYREFANYLSVPIAATEVLGCANMDQFNTQGAGALPIYWEQDFGQSNACKLVNYQTQFSAFLNGDYVKCVEHFFEVEIDYDN